MKRSTNFNGQKGERGRTARGARGFAALAKFSGMENEKIIETVKKVEESSRPREYNFAESYHDELRRLAGEEPE